MCLSHNQQIEALREKLGMESQQLSRTAHAHDSAASRVRILEDERSMLEGKLHKLEAELAAVELSRDSLRKDKANVSESNCHVTAATVVKAVACVLCPNPNNVI